MLILTLSYIYLLTELYIEICFAEPDAPSSITIQQNLVTKTSITINILHGTGNVEYFYVRKNGTFYQQDQASNNHTTQVTIEGLKPGTLYGNVFFIYASSNGLNSSSVMVPKQETSKSKYHS